MVLVVVCVRENRGGGGGGDIDVTDIIGPVLSGLRRTAVVRVGLNHYLVLFRAPKSLPMLTSKVTVSPKNGFPVGKALRWCHQAHATTQKGKGKVESKSSAIMKPSWLF